MREEENRRLVESNLFLWMRGAIEAGEEHWAGIYARAIWHKLVNEEWWYRQTYVGEEKKGEKK